MMGDGGCGEADARACSRDRCGAWFCCLREAAASVIGIAGESSVGRVHLKSSHAVITAAKRVRAGGSCSGRRGFAGRVWGVGQVACCRGDRWWRRTCQRADRRGRPAAASISRRCAGSSPQAGAALVRRRCRPRCPSAAPSPLVGRSSSATAARSAWTMTPAHREGC